VYTSIAAALDFSSVKDRAIADRVSVEIAGGDGVRTPTTSRLRNYGNYQQAMTSLGVGNYRIISTGDAAN